MQIPNDIRANPEDLNMIEAELRNAYRNVSPHVRTVVAELIRRTSPELTDHFYQVMISQPGAHFYLNHEVVNQRLRQGLKRWLTESFQRDLIDVEAFTRRQMQVGSVHARIKLPEILVSRGMRALKQNIYANLRGTQLSREDIVSAMYFISIVLDLTLDVMTYAYINRAERNARSDEAFRLFSFGQSLATERQRQRASLSEWAQSLFFELQMGSHYSAMQHLAKSEFGVWLFHRANLIFERSPKYDRLVNLTAEIDGILEMLGSSSVEGRIEHLRRIKMVIDEMNSLVAALFDRSIDAQGARDPLTQLLNRKYIGTVISAEITTQKLSRRPFSVLLIEIDRFGDLRSRLGEAGADIVVQRTAQMLFDAARSSDSVFSMGRETFLIVQVDADLAAAARFADELIERYASSHFVVAEQAVSGCSLSIGVVEYDGHPDPREMVTRAQRALFECKGRRS